MDDDQDYRIRFRAHELWEQSGEPNGTFLDFWFAAEAELKSNRDETRSDLAATLAGEAVDRSAGSASASH